MSEIEALRERLLAAPATKRTHQAQNYLRIAEAQLILVKTMLKSGLDDRPLPHKLTHAQRLLQALKLGTFKPPNAAALREDFDRAHAGDRAAKERIINYLRTPGVLEALDND